MPAKTPLAWRRANPQIPIFQCGQNIGRLPPANWPTQHGQMLDGLRQNQSIGYGKAPTSVFARHAYFKQLGTEQINIDHPATMLTGQRFLSGSENCPMPYDIKSAPSTGQIEPPSTARGNGSAAVVRNNQWIVNYCLIKN